MLATTLFGRKLGRPRLLTGNRRRLLVEPLEGRRVLAGFSIIESGGITSVTEAGLTDTFAISLTEAPASDVVLSVASSDTSQVTASPESLTFTPTNWNLAQTVTATGVNDTLRDGNETITITVAVNDALSDEAFDRVADQIVRVTTLDDEVGPPAPGTAIVVPDPQNPAGQMLVVTGTSDNDSIRVRREGREGVELAVRISGKLERAFDGTGISRIQIFAQHGNDTIRVAEEVTIPVHVDGGAGNDEIRGGGGNDQLFGNAGNDRMYGGPGNDVVRGGQGDDRLIEHEGNDILLGGAGNDHLSGGDGRDILIGGSGHDRLQGQDDDDILIGGTTKYDNNDAALQALLSEWTSDRSFGVRRANLRAGTGEILAAPRRRLLEQKTVFRSGRDNLDGGDGDDLVFFPTTSQSNRNRNHGSSGSRGNKSSGSSGDRISGNDFPEFKPVRDQFRDAGLDLADSARSLFRG
jgi:Ca2+-binding RTX toxin-like protein